MGMFDGMADGMSGGMNDLFDGKFGKIEPGLCRMTTSGDIAIKCSGGKYKTYNVKRGTLTNVTGFCFNMGDDMYFVMPTNKVQVGDIILANGKPKCVTAVNNKKITAIDYEKSEEVQIIPERHVFMGKTYLYGRITSLFGSTNFLKGKGGLNGVMKMYFMSKMFGGKCGMFGGAGAEGGMGNMFAQMMQFKMMSGMFGGLLDGDSKDGNGLDILENMFDFSFDDAEIAEDNEDETDDKDEE